MINRLRDRILALVDRSERLSRASVRLLVLAARRSSAVPEVLDEAVERTRKRPLARSAQIIQWAHRVTVASSSLPGHFDPAEHLTNKTARAAACSALEQRLRTTPDDDIARRQLLRLRNDRALDVIAQGVEADIQSLLRSRSTTADTLKGGIAPAVQLEVVDELTNCLATIGVHPFLMSGTLLGIIRSGDFMAHDYDIDLGLMPNVDLTPIPDLIHAIGYDTTIEGDRIVAVHPSGSRTDLFPHRERDGMFWHGTLVHEWWNTPFDLTSLDVGGSALWIPDDPNRYLDENYGDWSRPVAFYDISFDTPNRVYRQNSEALLHLHSRCIIALRNGDRWLLESSARELRDNFGVNVTDNLAASRLLTAKERL